MASLTQATRENSSIVNPRPMHRRKGDVSSASIRTTARLSTAALLVAAIAVVLVIGTGGSNRGRRQLASITEQWWPAQRLASQAPQGPQPEKLTVGEFARLVHEFSEDGGYFLSDNLTSNETAYLHVVSKLRQLGATGGAYVGVGPEQNFTYIAKIRPRIAFIIDIRRQAIIQHLMFKAIFHLSPNRLQYLSLLLSRPLSKEAGTLPADAQVTDILALIGRAPANDRAYQSNLAALRKAIREDFQFPLSDGDQAGLEYVYKSFRTDGLNIAFKMDGMQDGWFPTLKELILEPDQFGKLGNFLASKEDYDFVREMHERNMIIPIVGDFAGKKALAAIGDYLRKNNFIVSAFYTSNVEQYLFQNGVFSGFVENVRKLPIDERSLFIRAVLNMRYNHPAGLGGHLLSTFLQQMTVFLKDYEAGLYRDYGDMVTTHYIAGEAPTR